MSAYDTPMTSYPPPDSAYLSSQTGYSPYASPGRAAPVKTSTKAGKILTFTGIGIGVVATGLVVLAVMLFTSIVGDLPRATIASASNDFTASNLKAGTSYVIFPSVTTSTYVSGNGTHSRSTSTYAPDISADELEIIGPNGQAIRLEQSDINSILSGLTNPVGTLAVADEGTYRFYPPNSAPAKLELNLVPTTVLDRVLSKATGALVSFLAALVLGFLGFVFLVWGIVLWAMRASQARKVALAAHASQHGGQYGGGPGVHGGQPNPAGSGGYGRQPNPTGPTQPAEPYQFPR